MVPSSLLTVVLADPEKVRDLPADAIPTMLGEVEHLRAALWARMMNAGGKDASREEHPPKEERLLTAEEAATILNVSPRWLYRHARKLPFARRFSRKVLRFSEAGLQKWQATRRD